jgi:hypothetical protein
MKGVLNVHRLMIAMETAKNDFFLCFVKRYLDSRLRQRTFLINIMQNSQKVYVCRNMSRYHLIRYIIFRMLCMSDCQSA